MAQQRKKNPDELTILQMSHLEQARLKLSEVRASRRAAEEKGVYTCVPPLHKLELAILEEVRAASAATASSDVSSLSVDDLVDAIVEVVPTLSEAAAQRLTAALAARPPHLRLASGV